MINLMFKYLPFLSLSLAILMSGVSNAKQPASVTVERHHQLFSYVDDTQLSIISFPSKLDGILLDDVEYSKVECENKNDFICLISADIGFYFSFPRNIEKFEKEWEFMGHRCHVLKEKVNPSITYGTTYYLTECVEIDSKGIKSRFIYSYDFGLLSYTMPVKDRGKNYEWNYVPGGNAYGAVR